MTVIPATAEQVRRALESEGFDVRIWNDGQVFVRRPGEQHWDPVGWVDYFQIIDGMAVLS